MQSMTLVSLSRWWWRLWTGFDSLESKRRALEVEVGRFGGTVTWRDSLP